MTHIEVSSPKRIKEAMSIFFKYRGRDDLMNSSFSLMSGVEPDEIRLYHVGDEFSVLMKIRESDLELYNSEKPEGIEFAHSMFGDATAHVRCHVVRRSHACSYREPMKLQMVSHSITIEAVSDAWEEVLEWFLFDEKPSWMMKRASV